MADESRPRPPRRRVQATVHVSADSWQELAVHLMQLGQHVAVIAAEGQAQGVDPGATPPLDRYTAANGASSHLAADEDKTISPHSYHEALQAWGREVLRTHPRADHRAAADAEEVF